MKKLYLLLVAVMLTCSVAFAQSPTPYEKGKELGISIVKTGVDTTQDSFYENIVRLSVDLIRYAGDDSNSMEMYLSGLGNGVYMQCEADGIPKQIADNLLEVIYSCVDDIFSSDTEPEPESEPQPQVEG